MFVSNTETTISLSRETSLITNLIARSNSDKSPRITSVSSESIRVKEKLKKKQKYLIMNPKIFRKILASIFPPIRKC